IPELAEILKVSRASIADSSWSSLAPPRRRLFDPDHRAVARRDFHRFDDLERGEPFASRHDRLGSAANDVAEMADLDLERIVRNEGDAFADERLTPASAQGI